LNKMMLYGGILLVIIALILGVVQHFGGPTYNMYGDESNKWYFYGLVGVIGVLGIVLAIWTYMKKTEPAKT
jgi:Na+/melibiose symporter-like transporter